MEIFVFDQREQAKNNFFSSRSFAAQLRKEIESKIPLHDSIILNFSNIQMTQSFADELIGVLAYMHGASLFKKLSFKGCTEDNKQIISFVVNNRISNRLNNAEKFISRNITSNSIATCAV